MHLTSELLAEQLPNLSKTKLIEIIKDLYPHVDAAISESIIRKQRTSVKKDKVSKDARAKKLVAFPWERYQKRYIALRFSYMGETYDGLARQKNTLNTVEEHLSRALVKSKLIVDIEDCSYSRCGRTDKGVSGFHQVVALYVRSDVPKDAIIENGKLLNEHWPDDAINIRLHGQVKQITEVDYVARLNKQLPMDIRVSGWCPVSASFDARFSALYRTYRYYFVRKSLDLEKMKQGAALLEGLHDFRNFCKTSTSGDINYHRYIFYFTVHTVGENTNSKHQPCYFEICGKSFLWHQVRCMASVLFSIGRGDQSLNTIPELLDTSLTPIRPNYKMASPLPLVLYDCAFENTDFRNEPDTLFKYYKDLEQEWEKMQIRTLLLGCKLDAIRKTYVSSMSLGIQKSEYLNFKFVLQQNLNQRKHRYF